MLEIGISGFPKLRIKSHLVQGIQELPRRICERQLSKNLKGYGMLETDNTL